MIKQSKAGKRSPIKKLSSSRAHRKDEYVAAYKKQDDLIMEDQGFISCTSCEVTLVSRSGSLLRNWGHSHNMPVGQYPELEKDPRNFSPRCQNWMYHKGCHEKLDNQDFAEISKFKDLEHIMEYRRQHDKVAYNKFVTGLKEVGCNDYDYID